MNQTFKFLASSTGRIVRIVVGAALIAWGFFGSMSSATGIIMIIVGFVPLLAGIFDVCVFAPLFGKPFKGKNLRDS